MFNIFFAILYYELLIFLRDKQTLFYALGFFILVTFLFPIALSPHPDLLQKFAPGILWVAALLASLLTLENWLDSDLDEQALEQLLLSSHPLPWLIAAKMLAFWLAAILPLILVTPLLGLMLHLSWLEMGVLMLSLLAGTPALIALGATCKTLILRLQQGALLGLLVLPLVLPILILGINTLIASRLAFPLWGNLAFLSGLSLLSLCLLPYAMASILKWGIEE